MPEASPLVLLVNGRVRTNNPQRPLADALGVAGDAVILVGSSAEVQKLGRADSVVIDLCGATVRADNPAVVLRRGAIAKLVVENTSPEVEHALRASRIRE